MSGNNSVEGRIVFPGNPWPDGHRVVSCAWVGAIEPRTRPGTLETYDTALSIGWELKTANYYEADGTHLVPDDDEDDEDEHPQEEWQAKAAWNNYHSCWIGMSRTSSCPGIVVSDGSEPFDFAKSDYTFAADPLPVDWEDFFDRQAFGIYLLGHDAVADHRIRLHDRQADGSYTLDWHGRIAMTYVGKQEFDHHFQARVRGVRLDAISLWAFDPKVAKDHFGLDLDPAMTPRDYIAPFVKDPDGFIFERRNGTLYAVAKSSGT